MTEDEFLILINQEIEKLNKQHNDIIQKYNNLKNQSKTKQELEYILLLNKKNIQIMKEIINIQTNIILEVLENNKTNIYKINKLSTYQHELEKINRINKLTALQQQLARINNELENNQNITQLIHQKATIIQQIKQMIETPSNKQINKEFLNQLLNRKKTKITNLNELKLLTPIINNPTKAIKIIKLLNSNDNLYNQRINLSENFSLPNETPIELIKNLNLNKHIYNIQTKQLRNPEALLKIFNNFNITYNQEKNNLITLIEEIHKSNIFSKKEKYKIAKRNLSFLKPYINILDNEEFYELYDLITKLKKLENKFIITKKDITMANYLNKKLKIKTFQIIKKILEKKYKQIFELNITNIKNFEELIKYLNNTITNINAKQKIIIKTIHEIEQIKEKMNKTIFTIETQQQKIKNEIITTADINSKEVTIPIIKIPCDNKYLNAITDIASIYYINNTMKDFEQQNISHKQEPNIEKTYIKKQ